MSIPDSSLVDPPNRQKVGIFRISSIPSSFHNTHLLLIHIKKTQRYRLVYMYLVSYVIMIKNYVYAVLPWDERVAANASTIGETMSHQIDK